MHIISIREHPELVPVAIPYFQTQWAKDVNPVIFEDCISHCVDAENPLPQWYLLYDEEKIIGCAGLITNDFISRMDLYPWVCSVYIDPQYRGHRYGGLLVERAREDAKKAGFSHVYLYTHLEGYYEKFGFEYVGLGYHTWGTSSRIYGSKV